MWFALVLAILVKLLIETENPLLCAGIYAGLVAIGNLLVLGFGLGGWLGALLGIAYAFLLSFGYFWLLDRIETGSPPWWGVLVGGAIVAFFVL